jgi:hypothetical protein
MHPRPLYILATLVLVGSACSSSGDAPSDSAAPPPPGTPRPAGVPVGAGWRVSMRGIGPIDAGVRLASALPDTAGVGEECAIVRSAMLPAGVSLLVTSGVIARVQVDSGDTRTAEGARIGDSEARVQELYAGRVTATPHKYTEGRYLTVVPTAAGDSNFRLLFETDGQKVTRYRAGRLPEVAWVEGCS